MGETFSDHPRKDIKPGDRTAKVRVTFMRRVQARFFLRFHMSQILIATVPAPAVTRMSGCGEDRK